MSPRPPGFLPGPEGVPGATLISALRAATCHPSPAPTRATGSRRRRLWELPRKLHCPIIGVCFACDELRAMAGKLMSVPADATDFTLHTLVVSACDERTAFAELVQKTLDRRYRQEIRQLAACKTAAELRAAWHAARAEGGRIPAFLWAAWGHPGCDGELQQELYGDIHMIQHQVGAGARADLQATRRLAADNERLRRELGAMRAELELARRARAEAEQRGGERAGQLRTLLASSEARCEGLRQERDALCAMMPELGERQRLVRQRELAERRAARLRARLETLEEEAGRLREFARYAEERFEALASEDEALAELPCADLGGKCVLCVGGRAGSVHCYRELVEQSGGRFLHHDGGLEENLRRIDGALAAADLVICQAGCISHNAYWRVKDLCKRTGKPCLFVKTAGVSSFGRSVETLAGRPPP